MGGLRKQIPLVYWCFVIGGAALAALPLTVGIYSKDEILWETFASGHQILLVMGVIGAFMTSLYTFRLIFIVFHGPAKGEVHKIHGVSYGLPLVILLVLSTLIGAKIHPPLAGVLPAAVDYGNGAMKTPFNIFLMVTAIVGVGLSALLFLGERGVATRIASSPAGKALHTLWYEAWGFDKLYDVVFTKPFNAVSRLLAFDVVDRLTYLISGFAQALNWVASAAENGKVRSYATSIAIGVLLTLLILIAL